MARPVETIVYPQPKGLPLKRWLSNRKARYGYEDDFNALAAYDGTQNASRIHWPSLAKGAVTVKRFETRLPQEEILRLDFDEAGEDTETRLSQLTLWILECEAQNRPFFLHLPNETHDSRKESVDAILARLALF